MNRTDVLDRVGDLQFLPNMELSTTKQVADFYGVETKFISCVQRDNKSEVESNGMEKGLCADLKESLLAIAGTPKKWVELSRFYGIATGNTNLYSKTAVLNVGFLLEESPIAEKVRRLVMTTNVAVATPVKIIKAEPIQKQHNEIVVSNNAVSNEIVVVQNNQAVTTSLQVAETFGKHHDNVIQAIENLATEISGAKNMFYESTYENRGKQYPMFYMNRDGFTLLAMGFTGKKAMKFKLEYINQFNLMENQLQSQAVTVASYMITDPIKRAEQWIAEQKEVALLAEKVQEQVVATREQTKVITHKQDVIATLRRYSNR